MCGVCVLYLYEFTLLSNLQPYPLYPEMSYTSMNLHYSQTMLLIVDFPIPSYTSMNLHYSQTKAQTIMHVCWSYTSMNLHYSQTSLK